MKFKQIILAGAVLATSTFTSLTNVQAETGFRDVPSNHWSYNAIMDLKERQIFAGYGNGIFGFGDPITRGQVARLLYTYIQPVTDPTAPPFKNPFNDVKGTMFEKEILAIARAGIMNGYGNGKFGPDDTLTREQLAAVLKKAFRLRTSSITTFEDVEKNYWATDAISALQENKIVVGTGNNMFEPKRIVTREQYAQFLYNAINFAEAKPELPPFNLPSSMITSEFHYDSSSWINSSPLLLKSVSKEAQNLITKINKNYNEDFKYESVYISGGQMGDGERVELLSSNPNLGKIYDYGQGQLYLVGENENDFMITFIIDKATVELAKNWVTLINPDLNLDKEINDIVTLPFKNSGERDHHAYLDKGNYKMELGTMPASNGYERIYINVKRK
ncbi:TPA: S-layer homology domain-containing protein [Bacillus tropicus]|nr:S-layer homology domain-containing protein [Bacillus tropicus]